MKICVFTGTRAEYGLLKPIMDRIDADPELELQVLVSGSHLSEQHGMTIDAIRADGTSISATVPLSLEDDSAVGISQACGEAMQGCARAFDSLQPDMLVLLGDRYECLACAMAASMQRIPVAHIHGGEKSEGAVDDFFRHAITKMAHLHFTSCEEYRNRVIQLGEQPDSVFCVGAPGVENIKTIPLLAKDELENQLNFTMGDACLLTTYHPVTLDASDEKSTGAVFVGFNQAMEANPAIRMILTGANADPGGAGINAMASRFKRLWGDRVLISQSLGLLRYLSAMKFSAAVVGNSSSGIIETPSFHIPTVNIGERQKGRFRAASVLDVEPQPDAIANAIKNALGPFALIAKSAANPYERDKTSERIVDQIKKYPGGVTKSFYDLPVQGIK